MGKARKWADMTPEERAAYVNQDIVKPGWREIPASHLLEVMEPTETLADVMAPTFCADTSGGLLARLDPLAAHILAEHYGEGRSYGQIAKQTFKVWAIGRREIKRQQLARETVTKIAQSARRRLALLLEEGGAG